MKYFVSFVSVTDGKVSMGNAFYRMHEPITYPEQITDLEEDIEKDHHEDSVKVVFFKELSEED